jgi:hypothetical protein
MRIGIGERTRHRHCEERSGREQSSAEAALLASPLLHLLSMLKPGKKGQKSRFWGGKKPSKPGKNPMTKFFADIIMIPRLSMLFRLCGRHKNFDGGNRPHVREDAQRSFSMRKNKFYVLGK